MTTTTNKDLSKNNSELKIGFETDPAIDQEVRQLLVTARIGLLLLEPFFGNLATRMKLVNADKWLATAATDGRNFYYNTHFILKLPVKQIQFLFGHEILHCVYDHIGRFGNRDKNLSNIAADYCVNGDLIAHNIGDRITCIDIIHDTKYDGLSYEQIYEDLYKNAKKINIEDLLDRLLDEHLDNDNNTGNNNDGSNNGKRDNGKPKPLSQQELDEIKDEIRSAVLSASNINNAGNVPAGVKRLINELTEPRITWRDLLDMQIKSLIKSNFSFKRPNRKGWSIDAILPGLISDETIDIVIAIDTSGSISQDMIQNFMTEIKGIMEQYTTFNIKVMCFDTEIYNEQDFNADNMADFDDYKLLGNGGTSFETVYNYLEEHNITPMKLLMFTDGYTNDTWGNEHYCEVCYIIHTNDPDSAPTPEWGTWAYYNTDIEISEYS